MAARATHVERSGHIVLCLQSHKQLDEDFNGVFWFEVRALILFEIDDIAACADHRNIRENALS